MCVFLKCELNGVRVQRRAYAEQNDLKRNRADIGGRRRGTAAKDEALFLRPGERTVVCKRP